MLKCKICGAEFSAVIERHYISRDNVKTGLSTVVSSHEETLYDTFDCTNCGCQLIVQERKRPLIRGCDDAETEEDNTETS